MTTEKRVNHGKNGICGAVDKMYAYGQKTVLRASTAFRRRPVFRHNSPAACAVSSI